MGISLEEATNLTPDEENFIKELEIKIDDHIKQKYDPNKGVIIINYLSFGIEEPNKIRPVVRSEIQKKYIEKGWRAENRIYGMILRSKN